MDCSDFMRMSESNEDPFAGPSEICLFVEKSGPWSRPRKVEWTVLISMCDADKIKSGIKSR